MSDLAKPCLHSNPRRNACGKRCMRCACSLVYLFVRLRPSSCLVAPFAKAFRAWSLAPAMSHRVLDEEMSEASSSRDELHKTAKTDWQEVLLVPLGFVAFVVICGLDKVFLYRVHKIMADYTAVLMGIYWPPMLQAMCAVVSLGYVWRQRLVNLDVMWSFFWTGMWQVVWGVLLYPLDWVPWPTPTGHNEATPSHTTQDLKDSWTCFMGTNPKPSITTCDSEPAYLWFAAYLLLNVFFNLLFLWLIKRLSGTWAAIGSILCGNLGGFFSQYELFVGKSAAALTLEQWMALVLSSIAMWVYNIEDETDINGISVYGKNERGDHRYDSHGPLGLQPDPDEYASENEPTAQAT
ncbi:unnamed protein product [Effrenium voratum]|nr:unnamed protein product [Effrenium voratum]